MDFDRFKPQVLGLLEVIEDIGLRLSLVTELLVELYPARYLDVPC